MPREEEYNKFMDEYYENHKCCPKCGSESHSRTLVEYIVDLDDVNSYVDKNKFQCTICRYQHLVHDRVGLSEIKKTAMQILLDIPIVFDPEMLTDKLKDIITALLETEKKQIIDAFNEGMKYGNSKSQTFDYPDSRYYNFTYKYKPKL